MAGTIWSKFYWADWSNDNNLKVCSLGAQGLWMRMLCICAEADGYLMVAGKPVTEVILARLVGVEPGVIPPLIEELEKAHVFDRDRRGVILSRRMIRERKKADKDRENGSKGGNPTLRKQKENSQGDNPPVQPNGRIPDARVQKLVEDSQSASPSENNSPPEHTGHGGAGENGQEAAPAGREAPKSKFAMPPDWQPEHSTIAHLRRKGLTDAEINSEIEDCRHYWHAGDGAGTIRPGWDKTLVSQCARRLAKIIARRGHGGPGSQRHHARPDSWLAGVAEDVARSRDQDHLSERGGEDRVSEVQPRPPAGPSPKRPGPIFGFDADETVVESDA